MLSFELLNLIFLRKMSGKNYQFKVVLLGEGCVGVLLPRLGLLAHRVRLSLALGGDRVEHLAAGVAAGWLRGPGPG